MTVTLSGGTMTMYILLEIGTALLPTDEFYRAAENKWIPLGNSAIGFHVCLDNLPTRRLVTIKNSIIFKDHTSMTISIPKSMSDK
jgi:cell wall assembly regulator SMI1